MPSYTYVDVIPTLIENTTMQKLIVDGNKERVYYIEPNEGYVLHDINYDKYLEFDEEGNPIGDPILGYRTSQASCAINYDFTENLRQFYAVLASDVPPDQIFGVVQPPQETI